MPCLAGQCRWAEGLHAAHAVTLQGKKLKEKKNAQHHAWRFEDGAYIETTWDRYKAGLGNTVIVQTGADTSKDMHMHACTLARTHLTQRA